MQWQLSDQAVKEMQALKKMALNMFQDGLLSVMVMATSCLGAFIWKEQERMMAIAHQVKKQPFIFLQLSESERVQTGLPEMARCFQLCRHSWENACYLAD